jgi:hypothetical protein
MTLQVSFIKMTKSVLEVISEGTSGQLKICVRAFQRTLEMDPVRASSLSCPLSVEAYCIILTYLLKKSHNTKQMFGISSVSFATFVENFLIC